MKTINISHYFSDETKESTQEDLEALKGCQARTILDWVINGAVSINDARQLYDIFELG